MKNAFRSVLILAVLFLAACVPIAANQVEQRQVDQQQEQYVNAQPVPQFTWSLERHELIEIYKARNNAVSTFSVVYNAYLGVIEFQCPSYGYPIPPSTQLTNPEAIGQTYINGLGHITGVLPQAEPNGLYSPPSSYGTFVMCQSDDGSAYPVYVEENVLTFPFMMTTDAQGRLIKANQADKSSIKIDVKNPTSAP